MAYGWDRVYGDFRRDRANAIATDAAGNVYVTGYFGGTVSFGSATLVGGESDIFVVRLGPDGTPHWAESFGGRGNDAASGIAVDAAGNLYISGNVDSEENFGGGTRVFSGTHSFILSLSSTGAYRWHRTYPNAPTETPIGSIAVSATGEVVAVVSVAGAVDFGGGEHPGVGLTDFVIISLATDGSYRWDRVFGGPLFDRGTGVSAYDDGSVVVAGRFQNTIDLGGGERSELDGGFVLRLTRDGDYVWDSVPMGRIRPESVAVDAAGNAYVAGAGSGSADLGGDLRDLHGGVVWSLDAAGNHRWDRDVRGIPRAVAAEAAGRITVGGDHGNPFDFGGGVREVLGTTTGFLWGMDSSGGYLWDYALRGPGGESVYAVTRDTAGTVLAAGNYGGMVDLGGGERPGSGFTDIFVLQLVPLR